jgi:polysaccharide deacetylase 2 family uncharacterized protein YibQ
MSVGLGALIKQPDFRRTAGKAFAKGLFFVTIFFALLCGWMVLRADETLNRWQERFAAKTVVIESVASPTPPVSAAIGVGRGLGAEDLITPQENGAPANMPQETSAPKTTHQATPFNRYKKTVPLAAGQSRLAVVLIDLGIAENFTKSIIDTLQPGITLGFSPYAAKLDILKAGAGDKGFESWLMLPLEPANYPAQDSGPLTVLSNASLDAIHDHVTRLSTLAAQGYPGFVSNPDHNFSDIDLRTNPVMRMVAESGFGFAEGRTGQAFAKDYAAQSYIPYIQADEWLRRNMGRADIQTVLQRTEKLAQLNGSVVLMVEATPLSVKLIQEWSEKLPGRNIQIVPLSMLAQ